MTCYVTIKDLFSSYCTVLQLKDLKVSAYNGPSISDTPVVETPLPDEASQLLQPFVIHYYEGQVVNLTVKAGEVPWAVNMKRGLASLLQLDLSHIHSPAFVSTEVHCSHKQNSQDINTVIKPCHLLALNSAWLWAGFLGLHLTPPTPREHYFLGCIETRFGDHWPS
jgi:hypothetical protein